MNGAALLDIAAILRRKILSMVVRPHVVDTTLEAGYQALTADEQQEAEASEWCNALIGDVADETW